MNIVNFGEPDRRRAASDPLGKRTRLAEALQRFALGNTAARQRRQHRIGEMQLKPLLLGRR